MATAHVESARERTIDSRGALGAAFEVMMQGFSLIQEAVLQQERRTEERWRETERLFREAASEQERRLQEERQQMEATIASIVEEARSVATSALDKLRRVEARVEELERRSPPSGGERGQPCDVEERVSQLESRMERLEGSTERALQSVLPRVDELLNRLETSSSPVLPHDPTSISTSVVASVTPPASCASVSSPVPRPRSRSTVSAATPPLTLERREELGEQLLDAAEDGGEADVRRLLDEGANVNIFTFGTGFTPLIYAVCVSNENIVSLLIDKGADVNARNIWRTTALHYSAFYDISGRCASLLIYAGALVDSANSKGQTPLHWAATGDNEAAARALLAAGASKSVRDEYGKTPPECAESDNLRQLLLN